MAPPRLAPMLAVAGDLPAGGGGWAYEPKWDGMRATATVAGGRLVLHSRNGRDVTPSYPELAALAGATGAAEMVLDGEIVALDAAGKPSFQRLQERMHRPRPAADLVRTVPVTYLVFDLLWLDGRSLCQLPLAERRRLLDAMELAGPSWQTSPSYVGEGAGEALLAAAGDLGLEGVVAKRLDSPYQPGRRSAQWVKTALALHDEFVVGGWLPGEGGRAGTIGSLLLGAYDDADPPALHFVGTVGSGFTDAMLELLARRLAALARPSRPFVAAVPRERDARWVEPAIVVDVAYRERTTDGLLRQPSCKGIRPDKSPADVKLHESGRSRRPRR